MFRDLESEDVELEKLGKRVKVVERFHGASTFSEECLHYLPCWLDWKFLVHPLTASADKVSVLPIFNY